jgi:hypothetical protein
VAHPKHDEVRRHYDFRCGYCGVSEADSGGELTVDHYRPVSAGGGDEDDNLVYACFRCNLYKSNYFPAGEDLAHGLRVLHPLRDDITAHLREDETSHRLLALTETGGFHINLLQLNRPALIERRLQRHLIALVSSERDLAQDRYSRLHESATIQEAYIRLLHQFLNDVLGIRTPDDEQNRP